MLFVDTIHELTNAEQEDSGRKENHVCEDLRETKDRESAKYADSLEAPNPVDRQTASAVDRINKGGQTVVSKPRKSRRKKSRNAAANSKVSLTQLLMNLLPNPSPFISTFSLHNGVLQN